MKEIFESKEAAIRRTQGIIEMSSALRKVDDKKLYEACEKAAIFNESEELGEILNQALETVKSEHPELVSNPNANETVGVASASSDQDLFYGEYKLKLNLSSLSDGYIEIVVSKNGIETVKAEDKPKEAEKKEEEQKQEETNAAAPEENKTPEGDQTANQPSEEKKESRQSPKNRIVEAYSSKIDQIWTKIEDYIENLNYPGVALITPDEVVFIDNDALISFKGEDYLEDSEGMGLNLEEVVATIPIESKLDVRGVKNRHRNKKVYAFGYKDECEELIFQETNYDEIINSL